MFNAIDTSATGLNVHQQWIDVIANNIANVNDVTATSGPAFQAQFVQATALDAGPDGVCRGTQTTALPRSSAEGRLTYDPSNPLADANGNVRRPDINMEEQMGNMIMAQRAFQANASMIYRAKDAYQAALNIGKGV